MANGEDEITVEVTVPDPTPDPGPETPDVVVVEADGHNISDAEYAEFVSLREEKIARENAEAEETRRIAEEAAAVAEIALDVALTEPEPEPEVVVVESEPDVEPEEDTEPQREHWWYR